MNKTSVVMAERAPVNEAALTAPAHQHPSAKASPEPLDLDEIHHLALLRLGHDRRRYPSENQAF